MKFYEAVERGHELNPDLAWVSGKPIKWWYTSSRGFDIEVEGACALGFAYLGTCGITLDVSDIEVHKLQSIIYMWAQQYKELGLNAGEYVFSWNDQVFEHGMIWEDMFNRMVEQNFANVEVDCETD